jgi:hypothetical protein
MRKLFVALVVAVVVGVGGYFGVVYWTQQAATREVEAALDGWARSIGAATHGRIEFDLWSRTLKVNDIVVQSNSGPLPKVTVTQVVASGLDMSGKASRVEIVGLETSELAPGLKGGLRLEQKAPKITLTGFSARPFTPPKVASMFDMSRLWLEQFSSITAESIDIPSLTLTMTGGEGAPGLSAEYKYTNLAVRDVRDGRFAEATIDVIALRSGLGGPLTEIKGEIGKSSILDGDVGPVLAVLDPSRPRSDDYQRVYRQMTLGPYTVRMGNLMTMTVDSVVAEDIGLRSSKLRLDDLTFLTEVGSTPSAMHFPAQITMLLDKVAGVYEGIHLGKMDAQGFSMNNGRMGEAFRMAALRIDKLQNGRFRELSIEGFHFKPPFGDSVNMGRAALKEFDIAKLLRVVPQLGGPRGQGPSPDQITAMLSLIQGIEIRDFAVPEPKTRRPVQVDTINASWGQYIDGLPTRGRFTVKFSAPTAAFGQEALFKTLAGTGIGTLVVAFDVGSAWAEATQTLTVEPATLEIGRVMAASFKASIKNVTRDALSLDPMKSMGAMILAEVGPLEFSLRDLGLVDLLAAETARQKGAPPEVGRTLILENLAVSKQTAGPEAEKLYQALEQFVQGKGETLTIRVTPKGRVGLLELLDATKIAPQSLLFARFDVEATTRR